MATTTASSGLPGDPCRYLRAGALSARTTDRGDSAPFGALADAVEVFLSPVIVQEILQGARDDREWRALDACLSSQALVYPADRLAVHRQAARIYYDCRRRCFTVRDTIDCFIAQLALDHDLALLHDDQDYDAIRRVRPLKTLP